MVRSDGHRGNTTNFKFRNPLAAHSKSNYLGTLIGKFLDPEINLSTDPILKW